MSEQSISPAALYDSLGTEAAPLLLDVRRQSDFGDDSSMIIGAIRRAPDVSEQWATLLPAGRSVVVHCVRGGEVSQGIARDLSSRGIPVSFLGGNRWLASGAVAHTREARRRYEPLDHA